MHVLIVDPDRAYSQLLSTLLATHRHTTAQTSTVRDALKIIENEPIDLVVLEWFLPDGRAADLLRTAAMLRASGTSIDCVVLTASAGRSEVLEAVQCAVKSFMLKSALDERRLSAILSGSNGVRRGTIVQTKREREDKATPPVANEADERPARLSDLKPILSRATVLDRLREIQEFKAMSPTVTQITKLTSNPSTSLSAIAEVICRDQSVALKVLQLANSSVYERGDPVNTVREAVVRIGTKNIRDLVVNLELIDTFSSSVLSDRFNFMHFWEHSIGCGLIAAELARITGELDPDRAFTLGLVHDIGRMVLAEHFAPEYTRVLDVADRLDLPLEQVESRLLLLNHADILDRLLLMWNFPKDLVQPLACHHLSAANLREHAKKQLGESAVLALANRLTHGAMIGSSGNDTLYPTGALVQLLKLTGDQVGEALARAEKEAADVKFSLLAVARGQPWGPVSERFRAEIRGPLNAIYVTLQPGVEAAEHAVNRLRDDAVPPNVSVVHLASPNDAVPAASKLRELEEAAGGVRPPLLVFSPSGELGLPGEIGRGRHCERLPLPVTFSRLLRVLNGLRAGEADDADEAEPLERAA